MRALRDVVLVPIGKVRPNKRNVRTHSTSQVHQLVNSISQFGWTYPILTDESWSILAGHARYLAAQQLGCKEVPVIVIAGLSDPEKRALALADNKIAANAGWDRKLLIDELGQLEKLLPELDLDLEITGFDSVEIAGLPGGLAVPNSADADALRSPVGKAFRPGKRQSISRDGDLWELGPHKILCGQCLTAKDVGRLLGGRSAAVVITGSSTGRARNQGRVMPADLAQSSGEMGAAEFAQFVRHSLTRGARRAVRGAIDFVLVELPLLDEPFAAGVLLAPQWADMVLRDWQGLATRPAVLGNTGQTFGDVTAARGKGGSFS